MNKNNNTKAKKQTYSRNEVCEILGIRLRALEYMIDRNEIPVIRLGGRVLISKAFIDNLLKVAS